MRYLLWTPASVSIPTRCTSKSVCRQSRTRRSESSCREDFDFLDEIQVEMSSARQFVFALRFRREKDEQIFNIINRGDKAISEHGFSARRMSKIRDKKECLHCISEQVFQERKFPILREKPNLIWRRKQMRTKSRRKKELSDEQLEIMDTKDFFRPHSAGRDPLLHRPLHLRKLLQVLLGCD